MSRIRKKAFSFQLSAFSFGSLQDMRGVAEKELGGLASVSESVG